MIEEVFTELFFGAGSWLGLLLLLSLILGLLFKNRYIGALMLPVSIFLGINYLNYNLGWHAIIMFFTSIFILVFMIKNWRR